MWHQRTSRRAACSRRLPMPQRSSTCAARTRERSLSITVTMSSTGGVVGRRRTLAGKAVGVAAVTSRSGLALVPVILASPPGPELDPRTQPASWRVTSKRRVEHARHQHRSLDALDPLAQVTALHAERVGRVGQCRAFVGRLCGQLPLQHPVVLHPRGKRLRAVHPLEPDVPCQLVGRSTPAVVVVAIDVFFLSVTRIPGGWVRHQTGGRDTGTTTRRS